MNGPPPRGWRGWLGRVEAELEEGARELERIASRILDNASLKPGESVVDLGAGTGFLSFRAAALVGATGRVTAVDSDTECVEAVRRRAAASGFENVGASSGRLERLPFRDDEFDVAVSRSALVYSSDLVLALSEMLRVVKGGRFSVFEPLPGETAWTGDPGEGFLMLESALRESGGARSVDRDRFRGALEAAGAGHCETLVVHLEPRMRGRDPAELADEYLHDLPGGLAALYALKERFREDEIIEAVAGFADAAARGMVRCAVPCMFAWKRAADA